jgi:hypothetical protein
VRVSGATASEGLTVRGAYLEGPCQAAPMKDPLAFSLGEGEGRGRGEEGQGGEEG